MKNEEKMLAVLKRFQRKFSLGIREKTRERGSSGEKPRI
jgi:hypothetical protein